MFTLNRKAKRILQKKLGEDFPLEQLLELYALYQSEHEDEKITLPDYLIKLLKDYIPYLYLECYDDIIALQEEHYIDED